jgi:putative methionine-R-sulfoxide reductase with GAF domain
VCGHCAEKRETVVVTDVHQFAGHIACDSQSKSEIVAPIFDREDRLIAVLDLDATEVNAFGEEDREGLERIAAAIKGKL